MGVGSARLGRAERIRLRADYRSIYNGGAKIQGRLFTLFIRPNGGTAGRLGIAATRKLGGAVVRNRAKRLIREVFRRNKLAPGFDLVIVGKSDLCRADLTTLETEFQQTVERGLRRVRQRG